MTLILVYIKICAIKRVNILKIHCCLVLQSFCSSRERILPEAHSFSPIEEPNEIEKLEFKNTSKILIKYAYHKPYQLRHISKLCIIQQVPYHGAETSTSYQHSDPFFPVSPSSLALDTENKTINVTATDSQYQKRKIGKLASKISP